MNKFFTPFYEGARGGLKRWAVRPRSQSEEIRIRVSLIPRPYLQARHCVFPLKAPLYSTWASFGQNIRSKHQLKSWGMYKCIHSNSRLCRQGSSRSGHGGQAGGVDQERCPACGAPMLTSCSAQLQARLESLPIMSLV